mgnify:CR=1 FL=1|tara:strand:- start:130 stop:378 length:249 start_codon:yes stop_codon:yes gene_type:complete
MVYSRLSHYLLTIDQCKDADELINQYELVRTEYDLAGWEEDKNCLVAEDPTHQAYMEVLSSLLNLFKVRIDRLGGQLPGYGA